MKEILPKPTSIGDFDIDRMLPSRLSTLNGAEAALDGAIKMNVVDSVVTMISHSLIEPSPDI